MGFLENVGKAMKSVAEEQTRRSDQMLREAERRAEREGRTLNDEYYKRREATDRMKNHLGI